MGLPLRQIIARHPKIDFVLRSHSSANARLCFEIVDHGGKHIDDGGKYSTEFADFAKAVGAQYAIPFASNNCYLHPETERFNKYLNLGINVKQYFEAQGIRKPQCVVCAPGDGWDNRTGFNLSTKDWYTDLDQHIKQYQRMKAPVLERSMRQDARAGLPEPIVSAYAADLFSGTPFFLRRLFRGKPITLVARTGSSNVAFELDIFNRSYRSLAIWDDISNPIQIYASARVFQMCIKQVNWNSLGISKRVRFRVREADQKFIAYFLELNDLFDCEVLPLSRSLNARFIVVWLRRWREVLLYFKIAGDIARGRSFAYATYLPRPPRSGGISEPL